MNAGLVEEGAAQAAPVLAACCLLRIAETVTLEPQRFDATKLRPEGLACNMARGNIHRMHRISITCAQVHRQTRLCNQAIAMHTAGTCALIDVSACLPKAHRRSHMYGLPQPTAVYECVCGAQQSR